MISITPTVAITGGIVSLATTLSSGVLATDTTSIYRYAGSLSSTPQLIYQGPWTPIYIDDGELLQQYLDFDTIYFWKFQDPHGTAITEGVRPAASLAVSSIYLDKLIFRSFAAGISALAIQASGLGFVPIKVRQEMPLTFNNEILPIIVINNDLEQQENIQIGELVNASTINQWLIPCIVFRRYSINILTQNAAERNFYKDAVKGVFYAVCQTLTGIGDALEISWQTAQSQVGTALNSPGFYESQFMVDITGEFNVVVDTNYPLIESIVPNVSGVYNNIPIEVLLNG